MPPIVNRAATNPQTTAARRASTMDTRSSSGANGPQTGARPRSAPSRPTATPTGPTVPRSLSGDRPVVYPDYDAKWCVRDKALTQDQIDKMLGWREETPDEQFGDDYLFIFNGCKIRCLNNVVNRPIHWTAVRALAQEHLNRKWKPNGETIILGRTALILNGQHTLIGAKLAEWERTEGPDADHWKSIWPTPITLEKLVAVGVEETDEVINTMDTCKPRSLADVVYRSPYFRDLKPKDRVTLAKMMDQAIMFLWDRTGAKVDAYAPRRTHAEALDFLARHPKVEDAVRHIWEEYKESWATSSSVMAAGYAAGILYLMAASDSSNKQVSTYQERVRLGEAGQRDISLACWDRACEFWTMLRASAPEMEDLKTALTRLADPVHGMGGGRDERVAVLALAWASFKAGGAIVEDDLSLEYVTTVDGTREGMANRYTFGGIDRGNNTTKPRGSERTNTTARQHLDDRTKAIADKHRSMAKLKPARKV
jgi:hypothetical protein